MKHLLRVLQYTGPYAGLVILAVFSAMGVAALSAASIGAIQPVFDVLLTPSGSPLPIHLPETLKPWIGGYWEAFQRISHENRITLISLLAGLLLVAVIIRGFLMYLHKYLSAYLAERVMMDVREQLYAHLHTLSLGFFTKRSTGEIMARVTYDVETIGRMVVTLLENALKEPLHILGFLTILVLIKWQFAVLSVLTFPLAVYPIVRFGKKMRSRGTRRQERWAELNTILQETISGVRIVKAFAMEGYEKRRFSGKSHALFKASVRIAKVDALTAPVLEVLGSVGAIGAVWIGSFLVIRDILTPGELMAFLAALVAVYQPIRRLGTINNTVQQSLGGVKRVFEFLDMAPEVVEAEDAVPLPRMHHSLTFKGVSFSYDQENLVLKGIDFTVTLGEVVAIVGASGVGKTTLVNLIPRFYDPTEGAVLIDGHDLRTVTLKSLRDQIGIVTQETILFDDTIFNNIAYGRQGVPREQVLEAARIANAREFIEELPEGFETRIGEGGIKLSGGQRQRIAIARAVLKDPAILILDEATSALDAESERLVQEALERLMKDRTTFIIAHRLSTVIRADRILVLEEGRIVEEGTHAELLARKGVYFRLYQSQLAGEGGKDGTGTHPRD